MALKTAAIGRNYLSIPDSSVSVFKYPKFSFRYVIATDIAVKRQEGRIPNEIFEAVRFVFQAGFATEDQICRAIGREFDRKWMEGLVSAHFLNYFVLDQFQSEKLEEEVGDLRIYVMDFAGSYLLMQEGVNTNRWRYTDALVGTRVIKKALVNAEVLIGFRKLESVKLREYRANRLMRFVKEEVDLDFTASLNRGEGVPPLNLIGVIAFNGYEDLSMAETLRGVQYIVKGSRGGHAYYPDGGDTLPRLFVVVEDSSDSQCIIRAARVVGECTDFAGSEVLIVGYNELVQVGLANSHYYSIRVTEDPNTHARNVQVGSVKNTLLR